MRTPSIGASLSALLALSVALALLASPVAAQIGGCWPWIPPLSAPPVITIGDSNLSLTLTEGPLGHSVTAITSSEVGTFGFDPGPLWSLTFMQNGVPTVLTPANFATLRYLPIGNMHFLLWKNQSGVPGKVIVTARIWFKDGGFDFDIGVVNKHTGQALDQVWYPIIQPQPINPNLFGNITIVPFLGGGGLLDTHNPALQPAPFYQFPHPGSSMQFFSLFDRENGGQLFWQTKDRFGTRKDYFLQPLGTSTLFAVVHYPANNHLPNRGHLATWSFSMTALPGNWYDSAVRYRDWALQQPWAQRGPIETACGYSDKIKNLKLHVLQYPNHFTSPPFDDFQLLVDDALRVKNYLGLGPDEMMLLWSDWHDNVFSFDLPDFLPPRSSVPAAVAAAHANGIGVLPYTQLQLWSPTGARSQEFGVMQWAWTLADGTIVAAPEWRLNSFHCGTRLARSAVLSDIMAGIQPVSWDGAYLDTWAAIRPELDYNDLLPVKGGTPLWMLGKRLEAEMLHGVIKGCGSERAMTSEAPLENFVDTVELLNYDPLDYPFQFPVWETVYGGHVLSSRLGGAVAEHQQPLAILEAAVFPGMSYDYHLGKILGLYNFFASSPIPGVVAGDFIDPAGPPELSTGIELLEYVKALTDLEPYARKYRVLGERLRPLSSAFETGMQNLVLFPSASSSIWRASDGAIGIPLTNHGSGVDFVSVDLDLTDYGLGGSYNLTARLGGLVLPLGSRSTTVSEVIPLGPRSAVLLELTPVGP